MGRGINTRDEVVEDAIRVLIALRGKLYIRMKSKLTVFLHADNHFSAKIVKEKNENLRYTKEKETLKDLKKLMKDA